MGLPMMRRPRRSIYLPFLFSCLVLAAFLSLTRPLPASAADMPLFPDIKRIIDRGTLVVAVINREWPPLVTTDEKGNLTGFDISLANAIARNLNVGVEFDRSADTFDGVVSLVANREADVAISWISRTAERAKSVGFTQPYAQQDETVLINRVKGIKYQRNCPTTDEFLEMAKWPGQMGVAEGGAFANNIQASVQEPRFTEFASFLNMMGALYKGEITMSYQGELAARSFLHNNPAYAIKLKLCSLDWAADKIAIAVRPDAPNLRDYLNVFLQNNEIFFKPPELVQQTKSWKFW